MSASTVNYNASGDPCTHPCRSEAMAHFAWAMRVGHSETARCFFRWHPDLVWC